MQPRDSSLCSLHPNQLCGAERWLESPPLVKPLDSFLAFYENRRFLTEFTTALHLFLSWARKRGLELWKSVQIYTENIHCFELS
jgi:hypothetical protein